MRVGVGPPSIEQADGQVSETLRHRSLEQNEASVWSQQPTQPRTRGGEIAGGMDDIGAYDDVVGCLCKSLPGRIALQVEELIPYGIKIRELLAGAIEEEGRNVGESVLVGRVPQPRQDERRGAARSQRRPR